MGILRIPRVDDRDSYVLVKVDRAGGSRPLDVKLVATDGSEPYEVTVKHSKIQTLQSKNSPTNDADWESILELVLLGKTDEENETFKDIEAVATVSDDAITISIRKKIEGIIQRFGQLVIPQNSEATVELFDWCSEALEGNSTSTQSLIALQAKYESRTADINKLKEQLESLTAAKSSYENELLEKFAALLNEKKAKIRDQQRLLASAKVDPEKLARIRESRLSPGSDVREAGTSRSGKRKADMNRGAEHSSEDEDDSFEKMDVDVQQILNDSEQDDEMTADENDKDDDETADEDAEEAPATKAQAKGTPQGEKPPTRNSHRARTADLDNGGKDSKPPKRSTRQTSAVPVKVTQGGEKRGSDKVVGKGSAAEDDMVIPPRRTLPFQQKKKNAGSGAVAVEEKSALAPPHDADGDETASEEDEEL